jgi:hypothetical protein
MVPGSPQEWLAHARSDLALAKLAAGKSVVSDAINLAERVLAWVEAAQG